MPVDATAEVLAAARAAGPRREIRRRAADVGSEVAAARHTLQLLRLLLDGGELDEPSRLAGLAAVGGKRHVVSAPAGLLADPRRGARADGVGRRSR